VKELPIMNSLIELIDVSVSGHEKQILNNISFAVKEGEAWAIVGRSGSGKTSLAKVIGGQQVITSGELKFNLPGSYKRLFISQQHDFRDLSSRAYYQQRFDSNYGTSSPIVEEVLKSITNDAKQIKKISELLKIENILNSRFIELSNGEGKRVQLAKALLQNPEILILDNPFIGLDIDARILLHQIINELIDKNMMVFLISSSDEIPEKISHVVELENGSIKNIGLRSDFIKSTVPFEMNRTSVIPLQYLDDIIPQPREEFVKVVEMNNVIVQYNDKMILQGINWTVFKGEKWGLLGPNGAGKSTLLSLITGDNPKAYSNEVVLFDRKRGSGESIWDIKNKIGYISPEMHLYYQRNPSYTEAVSITSGIQDVNYSQPGTTCFEAVASGLYDQVGSSQKITSLQMNQVSQWMRVLNIQNLQKIPLSKTSLGEQRIVLLARALVKNPPLLILDEPCQGLDKEQTMHFTKLVDVVCDYFKKTLIYVSHYKEEIPSGVNNFLILEKGRVKEVITH
jgi:molybdate transport system ATP-binding protein